MDSIYDYLQQLMSRAQPRGDLITPGTTGSLENARPFTYMGRVFNAGDQPTLYDVLTKPQNESPDAEGYAGAGLASGAVAGAMRQSKLAGVGTKPDFVSNLDLTTASKPFVGLFKRGSNDPVKVALESVSNRHPAEWISEIHPSEAAPHHAAAFIKLMDQVGALPEGKQTKLLRDWADLNFSPAEALKQTLGAAGGESLMFGKATGLNPDVLEARHGIRSFLDLHNKLRNK